MFTTMSMKTVAPVRVRSFLRLSRARRRANLSPQIFYFVPFIVQIRELLFYLFGEGRNGDNEKIVREDSLKLAR